MKTSYTYPAWRFYFVIGILLVATLGLVTRLSYLMLINRSFLMKQGNARALRTIDIPAYRGMIMDRNHQPLAISSPVASVWVNAHEINLNDPRLKTLATLLGSDLAVLKKQLEKNRRHEFFYLKRSITPEQAQTIKALNIPHCYLQNEYRRFYPQGEVIAQMLGFTNIDDKGQEGLELAFNDWLQGIPGRKNIIQDRLGHVIENHHVLRNPKPGNDLILSIDNRIQYTAYRESKAMVEKMHARMGVVVVLDIKTGEILAMANQPSFNPNNRQNASINCYRNRAVTDTLEPGSTLKAFTVVNALMHSNINADTIIDTHPGFMMVEKKKVADIHNYGALTVTGVLQKSSNVGVTKITLPIAPEHFWGLLHNLGFGETTETHFPGEVGGKLIDPKKLKHPFALATLSFGYGLAASPLQLARAYATLANNGYAVPLSLLRVEEPPSDLRSIIPEKIAQNVLHMLESVVEEGGTAKLAHIPGYQVAGKTGTTRVVGSRGYEKDRHNSIFVGVAPAQNPKILVAVIIGDVPGSKYFGGALAGPVFAAVMSNALRIMNVPPDATEVQEKM
jgi:cell division protein FtsI (penicillin-binding protein 3)